MTERLRVREIDDYEGQRLVRIVRRGSGSVVTWRRAQMVRCQPRDGRARDRERQPHAIMIRSAAAGYGGQTERHGADSAGFDVALAELADRVGRLVPLLAAVC